MKKILLIVACALLSPMHLLDAAQETKPARRTIARKTTAKKPATAKSGTKKTAAAQKATTAKSKKPRIKTTTAGSKKTKPAASSKAATKKTKPAAKKTTSSASKKTPAARTKTTTAGTKAKAAKKSPKATKATTASRAKQTTYNSTRKPATKKAAASKKATGAQQPKRVYRKGGVTYRRFNHLNNMIPQQLGAINNPITQNVLLNKPGRGYVNANLINFTTPDGKEGQVVLDTHTITPRRAERKGFSENTHGKQSVEVFAGSDATGKGLALIGEYPLTTDNVQISVDPNGQVLLSGTEKPIEFSIHQ